MYQVCLSWLYVRSQNITLRERVLYQSLQYTAPRTYPALYPLNKSTYSTRVNSEPHFTHPASGDLRCTMHT